MVTNKLNSNMGTTSTNSESPYQMLRTWGMIFTYGLTLVCLVAFICTCVESQKVYNEHYDVIRVDKVFNPISLVYLFSCVPTLAFGALLSGVANIGDDVRAMKSLNGRNSEPTDGANTSAGTTANTGGEKPADKSTAYLLIFGGVIILLIVFVAVSGVFK